MGHIAKYCFACGHKLESRELKEEGMVPYCAGCAQYRFPMYNVAVSAQVMNRSKDKILLIKQYHTNRYVLVAGYVNLGESPEDALVREIKEEVGLDVEAFTFNCSQYFEKTNTLLINFGCTVSGEEFKIKENEVDFAKWLSIAEARENIAPNSLAEYFLRRFLGDDCEYNPKPPVQSRVKEKAI